MARSLMELYGGGMTGPTTNYQLGGRIASAQRGREYQGETRALRDAIEADAKERGKYGLWGDIASFVTNLVVPGAGGFTKAAVESGYDPASFEGGKYFQETRERAGEAGEEWKKGILERGVVDIGKSLVMPEVYAKAGETLGKSADWLGATFGKAGMEDPVAAQQLLTPQASGMFDSKLPFSMADPSAAVSAAVPSAAVSAAAPSAAQGIGAYAGTSAQNLAMAEKLGLDLTGGQTVRSGFEAGGYGPWDTMAGEWYKDLFPSRPTTVQGMMRQQENIGGGFRGGGLINYMVPKMQGGGTTSQHGYNPTLDPMGTQYGYGTATDTLGALKQMGMAGIAADPKLAQYMGDLPQFSMGYEQQLGDIKTGAQAGLFGLAGPMGPAATSFAGEGASGVAKQTARKGIEEQYGTQRRGVVEGYQADVLAGIRDIERKGEFEFQSPWGKTGETEEDWRRRTAAEQDLLAAQGTQLYSQQGLYGLQDPTQGQTGMPGQQQPQQQWGQAQWGQQGQQQQQNPWQQQQQQTTTGWPTG